MIILYYHLFTAASQADFLNFRGRTRSDHERRLLYFLFGPRAAWQPFLLVNISISKRKQKQTKIDDHGSEHLRCGGHALTTEERLPLRAPGRREFIAQPNRTIGGPGRLPPFERAFDSFHQERSPKLKSLRDQPEVVKILEAAVGDTECDHRLEFFGDDGFDRVGTKMRRWRVEQGWIVDVDRSRRHGVAKADVDLNRNPRPGNGCGRSNPDAAIFRRLADRCRRQRGDIKSHTVIGDGLRTDRPKSFGQTRGLLSP